VLLFASGVVIINLVLQNWVGRVVHCSSTPMRSSHHFQVRPLFEGLVLSSPILDIELALRSWPVSLVKHLPSLSLDDAEDIKRLSEIGVMSQERVEQHDPDFALELFEIGESIARIVCSRHDHDRAVNVNESMASNLNIRRLSSSELLENHHLARGPLAGFLDDSYRLGLRRVMNLFETSSNLNGYVVGSRPAWGGQASEIYKSMIPSMFDPEANRRALSALRSLAKAGFPVTILVGKRDFIGGVEHLQMLLKSALQYESSDDRFLGDFEPMPFRIRHRRGADIPNNKVHMMAAHLTATQSNEEATDIDYSTTGDVKGDMYTSGSISVYEVENASHFAVADDSSTSKEVANSGMGIMTAVSSGAAVGLTCDGDGISSVAYINTVSISPYPCCSSPSHSVNVISSGGKALEPVEFTNASFHRLTVTNHQTGELIRVIQHTVTSGAAPDVCGAFTASCTVGDFCDVFTPSITYWGFRTGCKLNTLDNVSMEYRVASRAGYSPNVGVMTIKYEVYVNSSKRLMCSIVQAI
jgi:hypothetical protein